MTTDRKPKIGFIGLGAMGSRMARRLKEAGYPIVVFNRTRQKAEDFARAVGARVAANPRELAQQVDVILSIVSDDHALEQVMYGEEGALAGARPGSLFIDLSSVYPGVSRALYQAAREKGASFLDAAVSGTTAPAEQGKLFIMVGGDAEQFEECRPILEVLGNPCHYMGPSGSGTTMKLVVNTLLGVGMQAIAEAVALGEKAGLDRQRLLDVLAATAVVAPGFKLKFENAKQNHYPVAFAVRLMHKDFGNILRCASERNVPMPATAVAEQMCAFESGKGLEEDFSAVIRAMEELSLAITPTRRIDLPEPV